MTKITEETIFELVSLSQPVYRDNQVYFIETRLNQKEDTYETRILSMDLETKIKKHWGNDSLKVSRLDVSPNGKWLSFVAPDKEDKGQVYLMPTTGGKAVLLTEEKQGVSFYKWSETSGAIYFQTSQCLDKELTEEEKKRPQVMATDKLTYKLDGAGTLPANQNNQIKKIDISTRQVATLMETTEDIGLYHVSMDETFLLYGADLVRDDEWDYGNTVYYYDIAEQTSHSLTTSVPKGSFSVADVKEDRYVLLKGSDFRFNFVTQEELYYYDLEERQLICLTEEEDLSIGDGIISDFHQNVRGVRSRWNEDMTFTFPVTEHGKLQLYKGDMTKKITRLFDEKGHLTDACYMSDTEMIVTYSDLVTPSQLAKIDVTTGKLEPIYNPNEAVMKEWTVSQPEMFWCKGAQGWPIQGWYVPPVNVTGKHPAILYVHGGPQVCYGETFFHEMQVHAARGYGVILLNPRGGDGYGEDFVKSILGDYGNDDFKDLMMGTDFAIEEYPTIDESNLFVVGGSYGGFMTNWIVGHTNRFRAAVTQRSISNWLSFYGTSDIGPFFVNFQLLHDINDVDALWQMSPLAHAHNIKTPLLVLHSAEDLRCPQEQGEQMYVAAKRQRVDTKLVIFPKSSHGLSRIGIPSLRMRRLQEIEEWFDTYL